MSFQTPLTTTQYNRLRRQAGKPRSYGGSRVISLFPSTVVLSGTIDTDLTGPGSWATFDFTNLTGDYLDTREGQEIFISTTANDINTARIIGRVRELGNATTMYPNESSERVPAGSWFWVCDNHVPQYKLSRSSTLDPTANPVELLDYDQTYLQEPPVIVGLRTVYVGDVNASGKLRIAIDITRSYAAESGATIASVIWVIGGVTYVQGSSTTMRIVVDVDPGYQWAQCQVTDSEGTPWVRYFAIAAHNDANPPFVYGDGGTINGSLEQGWTFTLPAFANVDDVLVNDFAVCWRRREVYSGTETSLWGASYATITNKVLSTNVATLTATNTFEVGQTVIVVGVDTTFDGTYVITGASGSTFSYQKTAANVGSAAASGTAVVNSNNVDFFGWLGSETDPLAADPKYSVVTGANFEFMSIGARMARLWTEQLSFEDSEAPVKNGQIVNLNPWRAMWHFLARYTTVADICEISFSNHSDTDFLFPVIPVPEETVQSAINAPAAQINAIAQYAPWGAIHINRQVAYLSVGERGTLTTVAAFESQDFLEAPRTFSALPDVSKVDSVGLYVSTATGTVQLPAPQSRAPGYAPGEAAGTETLDNQILQPSPDMASALTELELRAGSDLNFKNTKVFLDCVFPDSYVGCQFIPTRDQLFTFTLTAVGGPNGVNRIEYTTADKWTIDTVSAGHDQRLGRFVVRVRFRLVSPIGDAGDDTTNYYVAPGTTIDPLPDLGFPAFNFEFPEVLFPDPGLLPTQVAPAQLLPPKGKALALNGDELLTWNATQVFYERNVITLTTPTCTNITPPNLGDFLIKQCVVSPNPTPYAAAAYLLASDGTDSVVMYNPNIAAPFASMNWTAGATVSGAYSVIRVNNISGGLQIFNPNASGTSWIHVFDFTVSNGGWTFSTWPGSVPIGIYTPGVGFQQDFIANDGSSHSERRLRIIKTFTPSDLTSMTALYDFSPGTTIDTSAGQNFGSTNGGAHIAFAASGGSWGSPNGTNVLSGGTLVASAQDSLFFDFFVSEDNTPTDAGGTLTLKKITVSGTGTDPFGGGGGSGAVVRYSSDGGVTFGSEQPAGSTSPGSVGGFDVQRAGTVSYAASDQAVYKATTLGGAYSSFITCTGAEPVCIIIPYYKRNTTTKNTNSATPDFLVALTTNDGDGSSLYWVAGATGVKTDIVPVAGMTFQDANCVTTRYGNEIIVYGTVAGAKKMYRSVNGGTSWTLVATLTAPGFVRCRRNDTRPSPNGQVYLADSDIYYSSKWASNGIFVRNQPAVITGLDTIF